MQPVRYEKHCQSCHPLAVRLVGDWEEPRLRELAQDFALTPAPHPPPGGSADVVRGVLRDRLARLILRAGPEASSWAVTAGADDLLAPSPAEPLAREQFAWVNLQQAAAERRLFEGAGGCAYCHQEKTTPGARPGGLPEYLPANIPTRWFGHAAFDHKSHQMLACTECHAAPASTRAADVLLPRSDTCRKCHDAGAGKARADCAECHTYHDHGGRAEFRGWLTIEAGAH
jgi:cytochrome c551/c552